MSGSDVIVIGSGINGMAAALLLARTGHRVRLLERHLRPGGLIATEELTLPGYLHDTYSSWHGTFMGGPLWPEVEDDLARLGLSWAAAEEWVCATLRSDGGAVGLHRDLATAVDALGPEGAAYGRAAREFARLSSIVGRVNGAPPLSRDGLPRPADLVRALRPGAGRSLPVRDLVASWSGWATRTYGEGSNVDALFAPWLLHGGMTPDSPLGAAGARLIGGGLHRFGMPVLRGGASGLADALCALVEEAGGTVEVDAEVVGIEHRHGKVRGVRIARRAGVLPADIVIADMPGEAIAHRLEPALDPVAAGVGPLRPGRAAMQIHVALDAPPRWNEPLAARVPMIHIADGSPGVALACAEAAAGLLPARPTVVVGQQYVLDRGRVPTGRAALWIQLQEVPWHPVGDAACPDELTNGWTPALVERYVDRVLARIEEHAPGLRRQVLGTAVITPQDLQAHSPTLVHGDPYGGAMSLDQSFGWRLPTSWRHHRTAVGGLYQVGASTHPGPGLAGASGWAAARQVDRTRRVF